MTEIEIVRGVNAAHPEPLQTNINATCYQFIRLCMSVLKGAGHVVAHVGKTAGEGQYTPQGWTFPEVNGFRLTGVSHDAIWCDGKQFDLVARGNDSPDPIFDSRDHRITGEPVWNAIPPEFWRANNPPYPFDGNATVPAPAPGPVPVPQPPVSMIPSYAALGDDAFFRKAIGDPLEADMAVAGQALNAGSSVWFSRPIYRILESYARGVRPDVDVIIKSVRNEWRANLTAQGAKDLPPLP